jgi:hypothetical protein
MRQNSDNYFFYKWHLAFNITVTNIDTAHLFFRMSLYCVHYAYSGVIPDVCPPSYYLIYNILYNNYRRIITNILKLNNKII